MACSRFFLRVLIGALAVLGFAGIAAAAPATGQPVPWQMGFQPAATPVMEAINDFHNLVMVIITLITLFVLGLLVYVMVKFNAKAHPVPTKTTHNTLVEVLWTVLPVMILVIISIPSFKLLYFAVVVPEADITVKATGQSWQWEYAYPDEGFYFGSYPLYEEDLGPGQPRLLATDAPLVVPAGKVVKVLVTSDDVIHAFAVPAFGVKIDAVPGRLNETWFQVDEPGTYYGQCSELCGDGHSFMPIEVKVLTPEDYEQWLTTAREEYARIDGGDPTLDVADAAPR